MTDRELANELLRLCKRLLVDSMTKNSALSALFDLHPKLSDGRILNKSLLESVMDESRSAAEETVAGPFSQLEEALSGSTSPEDISLMLQAIAGKL